MTESMAMVPASSVSALVFSHKDSKYFAVGRVAADQLEAYASAKGVEVDVVGKWVNPTL